MKHFLGLSIAIFLSLTLYYFYRDDGGLNTNVSSIKIYGSSSFIGSWGPGPKIKELFEKQTGLRITYLDMNDPSLLFQKMAFEGDQTIGDVILSLDQFDISRSSQKIKWKTISSNERLDLQANLENIKASESFLPYDWAPIAFVSRADLAVKVESLDDLLKPELKGKIALEDPRTSSPGLNFLSWIYKVKKNEDAEFFIKQLFQQVHSYSPSWSTAYGLFKNKQTDLVLSYSTSPIYHLIEEKDQQYRALEFKEGHPIQVEFAGVPETCHNCDSAIKFIHFLQTAEVQKIIMEKNYMLPLNRSIQEGTPFDGIKLFKLLPFDFETKERLQNWLNVWSELRKNES